MDKTTVYVYRLFNFANCKSYIGRTIHPDLRQRNHLNMLAKGNHPNAEMQKDYNQYGDVFTFSIIDREGNIREQNIEAMWMRKLMTYDERYGYNTHDWATQNFRKNAGLPYKFPKKRKS